MEAHNYTESTLHYISALHLATVGSLHATQARNRLCQRMQKTKPGGFLVPFQRVPRTYINQYIDELDISTHSETLLNI